MEADYVNSCLAPGSIFVVSLKADTMFKLLQPALEKPVVSIKAICQQVCSQVLGTRDYAMGGRQGNVFRSEAPTDQAEARATGKRPA